MQQQTRFFLIVLTVVLVCLSHKYIGDGTLLVRGYIIVYLLEVITRKIIEPKNKGVEIMGIADWTIVFHCKITKKLQGLGVVLNIIGLVVAVVVGILLDKSIDMGIPAYAYSLGAFLFLLDTFLHFKTVNVYEKGIQRGCKFYTWDELEVTRSTNDGTLSITYINNLIFKNQLVVETEKDTVIALKEGRYESQ